LANRSVTAIKSIFGIESAESELPFTIQENRYKPVMPGTTRILHDDAVPEGSSPKEKSLIGDILIGSLEFILQSIMSSEQETRSSWGIIYP
jgi:hypothetical protein